MIGQTAKKALVPIENQSLVAAGKVDSLHSLRSHNL